MGIGKQRSTFISYSRLNKDFAVRLARELKASGFSVWLDQLDIPPGSRWDDELEAALERCEIFMVILTPASMASDNVKDEMGYAIDSRKRILPVLLESSTIPLRLRRFQYVDFTGKSFDEGVEGAKELLRSLIETHTDPQMEIPPAFRAPDAQAEQATRDDAKRLAAQQAERLAEFKAEEERVAKAEADRKAKEEEEGKAGEEAERIAQEKAEQEQLAQAKAEQRAQAKTEKERKAKEEAERLAAQKAEVERVATTKAEAERKAKEEANRFAAQKAEDEQVAKAKAEVEHLATQKAEEERAAKAKAEAERKAREEAARLAAHKVEEQRLVQLKAENEESERKSKAEAARLAKVEAERLAAQKADEERLTQVKAKEEADRLARAEAERRAKEEADRLVAKAKTEAERKAKDEAERAARLKAEGELRPSPVEAASPTPSVNRSPAGKSRLPLLIGGAAGLVALVICAAVAMNVFNSVIPVTGSEVESPATEAPRIANTATAVEEVVSLPTVVEPTATATRIPRTPTPEIQQFFTEDFQGSYEQHWSYFLNSGDPDEFSLASTSDGLLFDLSGDGIYAYLVYEPFEYEEVRLDVVVENLGVNDNNITLFCHYSPDAGWYEFNVYSSGLYDMFFTRPDSAGNLNYGFIAEGGSNNINMGKAVNTYSIVCSREELVLYINDVETRSIGIPSYVLENGKVGISVASFDLFPVQVLFEEVKISRP